MGLEERQWRMTRLRHTGAIVYTTQDDESRAFLPHFRLLVKRKEERNEHGPQTFAGMI